MIWLLEFKYVAIRFKSSELKGYFKSWIHKLPRGWFVEHLICTLAGNLIPILKGHGKRKKNIQFVIFLVLKID